MNRRGFLLGMACAPALVHASNLMPLRGTPLYPLVAFLRTRDGLLLEIPAAVSVREGRASIECLIPRPMTITEMLLRRGEHLVASFKNGNMHANVGTTVQATFNYSDDIAPYVERLFA